MRFRDSVIWVTGASSVIGEAAARQFTTFVLGLASGQPDGSHAAALLLGIDSLSISGTASGASRAGAPPARAPRAGGRTSRELNE